MSNDDEKKSEPSKEKKHDSGAADLEKVTDYAEEKEILSTSTDLEDAIATISEIKACKGEMELVITACM